MNKIMKKICLFLFVLCFAVFGASFIKINKVKVDASSSEPQLVEGYYEIATRDDLDWFADQVNTGNNEINAKLVADITITGDFTMIGSYTKFLSYMYSGKPAYTVDYRYAFCGTFDGNGHTITYDKVNFVGASDNKITGTSGETQTNIKSFIQYLGDGDKAGHIKNLTIDGAVTINTHYGTFAGHIIGNNSTIDNCVNKSNITINNSTIDNAIYMGGIYYVSASYYIESGNENNPRKTVAPTNCSVINCINNGNIIIDFDKDKIGQRVAYFGGICYNNLYIDVKNCTNNGNIIAKTDATGISAGGIVDMLSCDIENCVNNGNIDVTKYVTIDKNYYLGGIVGISFKSGYTISNCYNTGDIKSNGLYEGGIIGHARNSNSSEKTLDIKNCYNTGTISKGNAIIGCVANYQYNIWGELVRTNYFNVNINNCYYLTDSATNAYPTDETSKSYITATNVEAKSATDLKNASLGDAYCDDTKNLNNGYPVLKWQNAPKLVDGYYEISSRDELDWFADQVNSGNNEINAKLVSDITITGDYTMIGSYTKVLSYINADKLTNYTVDYRYAFCGTFDGNGHTITYDKVNFVGASHNFVIGTSGETKTTYKGFIQYLGNGDKAGHIKNLTIAGAVNVTTYYGTFACVITGNNSTIDNCVNKSTITINNSTINTNINMGGIYYESLGYYIETGNENSPRTTVPPTNCSVTNCINNGNIIIDFDKDNSGQRQVKIGGICYYNLYVDVKNCTNNGNIIAKTDAQYIFVGGIVEYLDGDIENCVNNGNIDVTKYVTIDKTNSLGGITALATKSGYTISNCYNTGDIKSNGLYEGGIIGYAKNIDKDEKTLDIKNCYNTGTISNGNAIIGCIQNSSKYFNVNINNCYYLTGSEKAAYPDDATHIKATNVEAKSEAELKNAVSLLGNAYAADKNNINDGYPVLKWQNPVTIPNYVDGYYEISSRDELDWFADQVNSGNNEINAKLVSDITITGDYTMIGSYTKLLSYVDSGETSYNIDYRNAFCGTFDGNGHTITYDKVNFVGASGDEYDSNENQKTTSKGFIQYLGYGDKAGHIKNLTIDGAVNINTHYGTFAGYITGNNSTIENCVSNSDITIYNNYANNNLYVGGITSRAYSYYYEVSGVNPRAFASAKNISITNCINNGTFNVEYSSSEKNNERNVRIGGIVVYNDNINIKNCINNGDFVVLNENAYKVMIGGIVVHLNNDIENCANTGDIDISKFQTTGLTGLSFGGIAAITTNSGYTISNCYNTGNISSNGLYPEGGIIGYARNNSKDERTLDIKNCYNTGSISNGNAIIGSTNYNNKTYYTVVINNCYYLKDSATNAYPTDETSKSYITATNVEAKSATDLKNASLGDAYVADKNNINNGYPILACQLTVSKGDVKGVKLNKETMELVTGRTRKLFAIVEVATKSANKEVVWSSSNEAVATIDENGAIKAIAPGTTTITVTTVDGGYTASCTITVTEPKPISCSSLSVVSLLSMFSMIAGAVIILRKKF